eukprot:TRINITY_DN2612_c0_g1_i6.p1 TRINITY_DN2612_c0_g1~~TRINITY_DN2612_c0_g1_i6.p1  ORF type:complete len:674 (-),score=128.55 TRINITY_DN2612_c0_g1_i6:134-2155(-)
MGDSHAYEGWLLKWGANAITSSYKERYFVLRGSQLYYFRSRDQNEPNGIISLSSIKAVVRDGDAPTPSFKDKAFRINIVTSERTYFLATKSAEEQEMWYSILDKVALPSTPSGTMRSNIAEANSATDHVLMSGMLKKKGERNKAWKDRYFVLKGGILSYFKSQDDLQPVGEIKIKDVISITKLDGSSSQTSKTFMGYEFCVTTRSRVYYFLAKTKPERMRWMSGMGSILDMKIHSSSALESEFLKEGLLLKRNPSNTISVWKERYVVVKSSKIMYYKSADDPEAVGCIPFQKVVRVSMAQDQSDSNPRDSEGCFIIETNSRNFFFVANSGEERRSWITTLEKALTEFQRKERAQNRTESLGEWTIEKMSGMLWKRGPSSTSAYRERWFVIEDKSLKYFKTSLCRPEELAGVIPFSDISYVHLSEDVQGLPKSATEGAFMIDTDYRSYYLAARDREEARQWVGALEKCRSQFAGAFPTPSLTSLKDTTSRNLLSSSPPPKDDVKSILPEDEDEDASDKPGVLLEGPASVLGEDGWTVRYLVLDVQALNIHESRKAASDSHFLEKFARESITTVYVPAEENFKSIPKAFAQHLNKFSHCVVIEMQSNKLWMEFQDALVQYRWIELLDPNKEQHSTPQVLHTPFLGKKNIATFKSFYGTSSRRRDYENDNKRRVCI